MTVSLDAAAQSARPAPSSSASAPAKGASAAMERVQRAADSPLRAILEAAKVRRRIEPEPTGADAEAALRRATALRQAQAQAQAALPEAAPAAPAPAPNVPVAPAVPNVQTVPVPAARSAAVPPAAPTAAPLPGAAAAAATISPAAAAAVPAAAPAHAAPALHRPAAVWLPPQAAVPPATSTVILTLPEATTPVAPARAAGLDAAAVAPLRAASAAALLPGDATRTPLPDLPAIAAAPRLVHLVQPEIPQRLLDQLVRGEVTVEFVIGADGRVSGIAVLPPVPRPLVPLITAAVEQWRYAPLPAPRPHRVQLVFKDSP